MADHIAVACVVGDQEAYHDNGEFGAGFRLLKAIKNSGMNNVALFMIRQFGGINIGPKRFTIMVDLAELALEKLEDTRKRIPDQISSQQTHQSENDNAPLTNDDSSAELSADERDGDPPDQEA